MCRLGKCLFTTNQPSKYFHMWNSSWRYVIRIIFKIIYTIWWFFLVLLVAIAFNKRFSCSRWTASHPLYFLITVFQETNRRLAGSSSNYHIAVFICYSLWWFIHFSLLLSRCSSCLCELLWIKKKRSIHKLMRKKNTPGFVNSFREGWIS